MIYPDDDGFTNIMGYHLQQTVELALKHVLEIHGIKYPRTHDISDLVMKIPEPYRSITEEIDMRSREISHLEAETRYNKNYHASKELIVDISNLATELIDNIKKLEKKEKMEIQDQEKNNAKEYPDGFSR